MFSKCLIGAALFLLAAGCGSPREATRASASTSQPGASNLLRADFSGSESCKGCHEEIYQKWLGSPMRRMTRQGVPSGIRAPFGDVRFRFKNDLAKLSKKDDHYYVRWGDPETGERLYQVTKVIGGRYREDYVGLAVPYEGAPRPKGRTERILPVSYLLERDEWRYKGYSVMSEERPALQEGAVWSKSCSFCHNTTPWLTTLYDELHGNGTPGYQGAPSVELPPERRLNYRIGDEDGLVAALNDELRAAGVGAVLPDDAKSALFEAAELTRDHYGEEQLVELGIGCEACHGGAKAHAQNPSQSSPSFVPSSTFVEVTAHGGAPLTSAQAENHACARCHTVLFSRYPYTWEGGQRDIHPGGSSMNSGEARDMLLGDCNSELRCSHCHDPHAEDKKERLAELRTVKGNPVCLTCHERFSDPRRLRLHTRHQKDSDGSACLGCHMPRKNVGLGYDLTTYHRIGSPTDVRRAEKDRPLECALCHADKSVLELTVTMERWYRKQFDRRALQELYGRDLRVNVVSATLDRGRPHEQGVAAYLAGKARRKDDLERVLEQLGNKYPLMRFFAKQALEEIVGRRLDMDVHSPRDSLKTRARALLVEELSAH